MSISLAVGGTTVTLHEDLFVACKVKFLATTIRISEWLQIKRKNMKHLVLLLALICALPAHAINKCTGADGNVTFQDAPCAGKGQVIEVKPASGPVQKPAALESGAIAPITEAQRIEAQIARSQADRRKRDLQERLVPAAIASVASHRTACEQRQTYLAEQQYAYRQNLYGKTHAAQMASEMAANAASCDTKNRELQGNLETLTKECTALKCVPQ